MSPLLLTPDADRSAAILTDMLLDRKPFFFVRIGDGAVELLNGHRGGTCDREQYSPELAAAMKSSINKLKLGDRRVFWGDWTTAIAGSRPKLVDEWCDLVHPENRQTLDYEALLLMRKTSQLLATYRAIRRDPRKKIYIGAHADAVPVLGCDEGLGDALIVPMGGLFEHRARIGTQLMRQRPELVVFGAGMGGLIPVVDYWYEFQATTCIHLGSALDPLFLDKPTRSRQLSRPEARLFFQELL